MISGLSYSIRFTSFLLICPGQCRDLDAVITRIGIRDRECALATTTGRTGDGARVAIRAAARSARLLHQRDPRDERTTGSTEGRCDVVAIRTLDLADHAEDVVGPDRGVRVRFAVPLGDQCPSGTVTTRRDDPVRDDGISPFEEDDLADPGVLASEVDEQPAAGRKGRLHADPGRLQPAQGTIRAVSIQQAEASDRLGVRRHHAVTPSQSRTASADASSGTHPKPSAANIGVIAPSRRIVPAKSVAPAGVPRSRSRAATAGESGVSDISRPGIGHVAEHDDPAEAGRTAKPRSEGGRQVPGADRPLAAAAEVIAFPALDERQLGEHREGVRPHVRGRAGMAGSFGHRAR